MSLGKTFLIPQPILVNIYCYEGSSFKHNLTAAFRMDCKICPANLNGIFQILWECRRNAGNIKLAILSVTKDTHAFITFWENSIHFLFWYDRIRTSTSMLRSYCAVTRKQYKTFQKDFCVNQYTYTCVCACMYIGKSWIWKTRIHTQESVCFDFFYI